MNKPNGFRKRVDKESEVYNLLLFSENHEIKESDKIDIDDLDFMTKQLDAFITVYATKIKITDNRHREILLVLDKICDKLKNRRYDELINDPSIISYTPIDHSELDIFYERDDFPF